MVPLILLSQREFVVITVVIFFTVYEKSSFIKKLSLINVLPHSHISKIKKCNIKKCNFALCMSKILEEVKRASSDSAIFISNEAFANELD